MGFTQLFTGVVTILGTLVFMFSINVPTTIVVVILTPLSFFIAGFIARGEKDCLDTCLLEPVIDFGKFLHHLRLMPKCRM